MEMMRSRGTLRVCVVGPFCVTGPNGEDFTPRGQKERAVLAILALHPKRRRSRSALQELLWSDRCPEQSGPSLRTALSNIRRALGCYRGCLIADSSSVELPAGTVSVDLEGRGLEEIAGEYPLEPPDLCEGIKVRDRAFEHWIRDVRTRFHIDLQEWIERAGSGGTAAASTSPAIVISPSDTSDRRPWVRVLPPRVDNGASSLFLSHYLTDTVARGLTELGSVDVCDELRDGPGIDIRADVLPMERSTAVHLTLLDPHRRTQLWCASEQVPNTSGFLLDAPQLQLLVNRSVDCASSALRRTLPATDDADAFSMAMDAVGLAFDLDHQKLLRADELLSGAYERDARGIYLAWRAYLRTYLLGEQWDTDNDRICEESRQLARDALQSDPHNSTVLALVSYVYSFVLRDLTLSHEFAERSVRYTPSHPLGNASLGRVISTLGDYAKGYKFTSHARAVSGPSPYRYTIDYLCGITAALAGDDEAAIWLGELSRAMTPTYRAPLRYLAPLYLKHDRVDNAREVLLTLKALEPGFSLTRLREEFYPNVGLVGAGLLEYFTDEIG